ncbi:MAG: 50S ribosomal protein L21 [Candidatus Saccharimonadales bacterium]
MKKAVIQAGGKQYFIHEGETLSVELLHQAGKSVTFEPLLVIDGDKINVGKPLMTDRKVIAEIVAEDVKTEKVTSIRYKAKKRVHKVHGHRQHRTSLKIINIV